MFVSQSEKILKLTCQNTNENGNKIIQVTGVIQLDIYSTTQLYSIDDTYHFVFGNKQVVVLFKYTTGDNIRFLENQNDSFSRKLVYKLSGTEFSASIQNQQVIIADINFVRPEKYYKQPLPFPQIQKSNSFIGVKGCVDCFVAYTQQEQKKEGDQIQNYIVTGHINPYKDYKIAPAKYFQEWTEVGSTTDPYWYQGEVWVVFGYPYKQENQEFLFIVYQISDQSKYYMLASKYPKENNIKTSYALASIEYEKNLEIIGVGITGHIFTWDLTSREYKGTSFLSIYFSRNKLDLNAIILKLIANCTNSEVGEIFHQENQKWLIIVCDTRDVLAYNLKDQKTQKLQVLTSIPLFIRAFTKQNLVIFCDKLVGYSYLYQYSKEKKQFVFLLSLGRGSLSDQIIYIDLIENNRIWIQYSYRYDLININDCLKDALACTHCSQENYYYATEKGTTVQYSYYYGDGTLKNPYTSYNNFLVLILKAKRYLETFRDVETLNVNIHTSPSEKIILKQSLLNFDFNNKIDFSIQSADNSTQAPILAYETIQMNGFNSVRLENLQIEFNLTNTNQYDCGFSFFKIKEKSIMNNIQIKQEKNKENSNCYYIKIQESVLKINKYYLNNTIFSDLQRIIFVEQASVIEITDFKLTNCVLGQNFTILETNSYLKLIGKDIEIDNNVSEKHTKPSQIKSLFSVSEFDISNLNVTNNQFINTTVFSNLLSLDNKNIVFMLENLLLINNTFTIDSSHLFFSSFYSILSKPSHKLTMTKLIIIDNKFIYDQSANSNQESITNTATLFQTNKIANISIDQVQFINHHEISFISSESLQDLSINNFDCYNKEEYNKKFIKKIKSSGIMDFQEVQNLKINTLKVYNKTAIDQNILRIENKIFQKTFIEFKDIVFENLQLIQTQSNTYVNPISIRCNDESKISFEKCNFTQNQLISIQNSLTSSATALWIINPDGETIILNSTFQKSNSNSIYNFIYTQSNILKIEKTEFQESSFNELENLLSKKYDNINQNGGFIRALVINLNLIKVNFSKSIALVGSFLYIESFGTKLLIDISESSFNEGYSIIDGSSIYIDSSKTDLIFTCKNCQFNCLYCVKQYSSAIGFNSLQSKSIIFQGGSIKNIFGIQQSNFVNVLNTKLLFQDIQDIKNNEKIQILFPVYPTLINSQSSNITIQNCFFKDMNKEDKYPLLINSTDSNYEFKDSTFQDLTFNFYVINMIRGILTIDNSKFTNIKNMDTQRILQNTDIDNSENRSMIKIIKSELKVVGNSKFTVINCSQKCLGSAFYIQESQFSINDTIFSESQGFQGGVIYIKGFKKKSKNIISQSSFIKNKSNAQGGAIFLSSNDDDIFDLVIDNCNFYQNEAIEKGGAIYIYTSMISDKDKRITIKDSKLFNNTALVGGAISTQIINPNLQNTEFKDNKVVQYGQNIGSYPNKLVLMNQQEITSKYQTFEKLNSQKIAFYNFRSGDNLTTLKFQLQNQEKEIVNQTKSDSNFKLKFYFRNQSQFYIRGAFNETLYSLQDCIFEVSQNQIIGVPGSLGVIQFTSDQIKILDEESNQFLSNKYSFEVEIHFRKCEQGEYLNKYNEYQECVFCSDNTYSFDSLKCSECPDGAICKQGQKLEIKSGYWRENEVSDQIIECINQQNNCIGGQTSNKLCKEGNIGALCEECDNYGDYWGEQYSKQSQYNCIKCSNSSEQYWKLIITPMWMLISVFITIKKAEGDATQKFLNKILQKNLTINKSISQKKKEQFQRDLSSIYIKILINYLFIISSIRTFNLTFPSGIMEYPDLIGKPLSNSASSIECLLVKINSEIPLIYLKVLFSYIVPLIVLLMYIMGRLIMGIQSKVIQKYFWHSVINATIFLILCVQPDLVTQMISLVSCRKIGEQSYIVGNISYKCYTDQYYFYTYYLIFPNLIFWAFLIPLILFLILIKKKDKLENYDFVLKFGFLFKEYRSKAYFWEFIKIILKTIIIVTLNFYAQDIFLKGSLICVNLISYGYLSYKIKPFENDFLNKMDLCQISASATTIYFSVILYMNKQLYIQIICYLLIIIVNIWFLSKLLIAIFQGLIKKLQTIFKNLRTNIPIFKFFDQRIKNQTQKENLSIMDKSKIKEIKRLFTNSFESYMSLSIDDKKKKLNEIKSEYQSKFKALLISLYQNQKFIKQTEKFKQSKFAIAQKTEPKKKNKQIEVLDLQTLSQNREQSIKLSQNVSLDIIFSQETLTAPVKTLSYKDSKRKLEFNPIPNTIKIKDQYQYTETLSAKKKTQESSECITELKLFSDDKLCQENK